MPVPTPCWHFFSRSCFSRLKRSAVLIGGTSGAELELHLSFCSSRRRAAVRHHSSTPINLRSSRCQSTLCLSSTTTSYSAEPLRVFHRCIRLNNSAIRRVLQEFLRSSSPSSSSHLSAARVAIRRALSTNASANDADAYYGCPYCFRLRSGRIFTSCLSTRGPRSTMRGRGGVGCKRAASVTTTLPCTTYFLDYSSVKCYF